MEEKIYTIGDKEYTRQELLEFGKAHYPKFYWIKRGIGLACLFSASILGLTAGILYNNTSGYPDVDSISRSYAAYMFVLTIIFVIAGIVLIIMSFIPQPEENYIIHAQKYYQRLADREERNRK